MSENRVLHCWADYTEHVIKQHGFGSEQYVDAVLDGGATCMRERGHDGDHEWTPDEDIGITFEGSEQ